MDVIIANVAITMVVVVGVVVVVVFVVAVVVVDGEGGGGDGNGGGGVVDADVDFGDCWAMPLVFTVERCEMPYFANTHTRTRAHRLTQSRMHS